MLDKTVIKSFKLAAKSLSKSDKRKFMWEICLNHFWGSARKTETVMWWKRKTVKLWIHELKTGIECLWLYKNRWVKRIEDKNPKLKEDILKIVDRDSQTDPSFKTTLLYSRISAATVLKKLQEEFGYSKAELPCISTMWNILNRLWYNQKKLKKSLL